VHDARRFSGHDPIILIIITKSFAKQLFFVYQFWSINKSYLTNRFPLGEGFGA
jgi:hypothetical protein